MDIRDVERYQKYRDMVCYEVVCAMAIDPESKILDPKLIADVVGKKMLEHCSESTMVSIAKCCICNNKKKLFRAEHPAAAAIFSQGYQNVFPKIRRLIHDFRDQAFETLCIEIFVRLERWGSGQVKNSLENNL